jgi:hypothetical protein
MRKHWLQVRAQGKNALIRRELRRGFLIWIFICPVTGLWKSHARLDSPTTTVEIWLAVLALCLLGSYLTGKWRWDDFEKEHPEGDLPPSE